MSHPMNLSEAVAKAVYEAQLPYVSGKAGRRPNFEIIEEATKELTALFTRVQIEAALKEINWAVAYAQSDLGADFIEKGNKRIATLKASLKDI